MPGSKHCSRRRGLLPPSSLQPMPAKCDVAWAAAWRSTTRRLASRIGLEPLMLHVTDKECIKGLSLHGVY